MQTLSIDIETYSPQDLSKVGVYKYAENCEVMLVAYAYNDEPVRIVDLASCRLNWSKAFQIRRWLRRRLMPHLNLQFWKNIWANS